MAQQAAAHAPRTQSRGARAASQITSSDAEFGIERPLQLSRARCAKAVRGARGRMRPCALLLLLFSGQQAAAAALKQPQPQPQQRAPAADEAAAACDSELAVVMCGGVPLEHLDSRSQCCSVYSSGSSSSSSAPAATAAVAVAAVAAAAPPLPRPDLAANETAAVRKLLNGLIRSGCIAGSVARTPLFPSAGALVSSRRQLVPRALSRDLLARVRQRVAPHARVNASSGFVHPATTAGPGELALLRQRVAAGVQPQAAALHALLTGDGVPRKSYWGGWQPRVDTPAVGYEPHPMQRLEAAYGGLERNSSNCAQNYPVQAPAEMCGHVSLIELDSQQAHQQALAYAATGDERHAHTALRIVDAWATSNSQFGLASENGPLQAAWALAALSRAMELLRVGADDRSRSDGWTETYRHFMAWVDGLLMPLMDSFVASSTAGAGTAASNTSAAAGRTRINVYSNWHASIAEAQMAVAVLSDDVARYRAATDLYKATVGDYFKHGRGRLRAGRLLGESSETLRDLYHSQMGMGSLLNVAEMAWQQGDDLYSTSGHVLAAGMELHARLLNAWEGAGDDALPAGYRFLRGGAAGGGMPPLPAGADGWAFDMDAQAWSAVSAASGRRVAALSDGFKYLVGPAFIPVYEAGMNHFSARLGMELPETAALLARHTPEHALFAWGAGTLTHADTATALWRAGLEAEAAAMTCSSA